MYNSHKPGVPLCGDGMMTPRSLLVSGVDPDPVDWVNRDLTSPILLTCEHAGRQIPQRLGDLGLTADVIDLHIGWDIGAAAVTRTMARTLGCPAILQRYSRLVIDCNRPPDASDAVPRVTDGVTIPDNADLSHDDHQARVHEIFEPYQQAVTAARGEPRKLLLSVHSFTPALRSEAGERPWHIGLLCRADTETSIALQHEISLLRPDLCLALNQPYQIDDQSDWFVPNHGEASGLPHSLIEIRNDLIHDTDGQTEIADLLSQAVCNLLEKTC